MQDLNTKKGILKQGPQTDETAAASGNNLE